jgi:hypothetical protein
LLTKAYPCHDCGRLGRPPRHPRAPEGADVPPDAGREVEGVAVDREHEAEVMRGRVTDADGPRVDRARHYVQLGRRPLAAVPGDQASQRARPMSRVSGERIFSIQSLRCRRQRAAGGGWGGRLCIACESMVPASACVM